jgi:hypothetical protein
MKARISACVGVIVLALSLEGLAKPPEGKGKGAHGATPFIEFPVPARSVGVMQVPAHAAHGFGHHGPGKAPEAAIAAGKGAGFAQGKGNDFGHGIGHGKRDTLGGGNNITGDAVGGDLRASQAALPMPTGAFPATDKKPAAIPECGAR